MNYYNEFDPQMAAWLRELMADGLIPKGDVDERSIADVEPVDLTGYTQCHFFAGIAGWPYALQLAGVPDDAPVWTGSCPCQPFSVAGKGRGTADERHLWPEFHRLIAQCRPELVFGEQVASAAGRVWLAGVRADLEALDYGVGAADLCAAGVGAPHIRQRLYWLAHAAGGLGEGGEHEPQRGPQGRDVDWRAGAGVGRMAHTDGERHGQQPNSARRLGKLVRGGGLDYSLRTRLEGHAWDGDDGDEPGWFDENEGGPAATPGPSGLGEWGDSDFIGCTDGKARRIPLEPALFPLAHGVPGRVGLLRGAGNAICPPLAAEFIRAALS